MKINKTSLLTIFTTLFLTGCPFTNDEITKAGDNLEKEALKPKIDFPAENRELTDKITVLVDIDNSVEYKTVSLKVEGEEIGTLEQAPYEFSWDPYFWSQNNADPVPVTLSIRAITTNDNLLRSEITNVLIAPNFGDVLKFTTPASDESFQNIKQVNISWSARDNVESYEYSLNNGPGIKTTDTQATLTLIEPGPQQIKIRASNKSGHTGAWSSAHKFNLLPPDRPILSTPEVTAINKEWNANFSWSTSHSSSDIQISTDRNFSSIVTDKSDVKGSSYGEDLVPGIYYARVRTRNEHSHISEWSEPKEFPVGLFSHAIDMASYGWDSGDYPVDFVVNKKDIVIAASKSNEADGTGDDFYITKISTDGNIEWGRSYKQILGSPKSISKTSTGYILAGTGANSQWNDAGIIAIDEAGNKEWHKSFLHQENQTLNTRTNERAENVVQISENQYVILRSSSNCELINNGSYSYYTCPSSDNHILYLKRSDNTGNAVETETSHLVYNPASGTYDNLVGLLATDTALYAAGRYSATGASSGDSSSDGFIPSPSDSGAFLLELDKTDGHVVSERTGGGLTNSYNPDLIQVSSGDILVGFDNYYAGIATVFSAISPVSSIIENSLNYSRITANTHNSGFTMTGINRNNDRAVMLRFDENYTRVGLPIYFTNCFSNLDIKAVKSHPDYGTIVLGTDKHGSSYNDTHTVVFNVSESNKFTCPGPIQR